MSVITDLVARLRGAPTVDHPVFGRIFPARRPKQGPWLWETLDEVEHVRGWVRIACEAGPRGPSPEQAEFWKWLQGHVGEVVADARPLLEAQVEGWTGRPMSANPWRDLVWVGTSLPLDGRRESAWALSFASPVDRQATFTVSFENGRPARVDAGNRR